MFCKLLTLLCSCLPVKKTGVCVTKSGPGACFIASILLESTPLLHNYFHRFEPYSRGFGRRGRGRGRFPGNKWKHDLFEETAAAAAEDEQPQGEAADEAVDNAAAAEMQE